ncbi:hypothetical protein IT575_09470 [bacterium]|nr:hypothetical protein [bacterium]
MTTRFLALLALLACLVLAFSACGENHQDDNVEQNGSTPEPGAGLDPTTNPEEAVVDALINVLDYEIAEDPAADREGSASGTVGGPGGTGGKKIMAKIINPGDDILSEIIAVPGQRFKLTVGGGRVSKSATLNTALQIEFSVVEDLNGDNVGGDNITQTVPLALIAGKVARVDMTIRRALNSDVGSGNAPEPGSGELVYTEALREDALGAKDDFFGVNYATGQVLFDVDGNEFLDVGDDQVLDDANMNGWPDQTEGDYFDPGVNPPSAAAPFLSGMIISVDLAAYAFDLQTDDGRLIRVTIEPFALIAPLTEGGDLLGQVILDPSMVGTHVSVDGVQLDEQSFLAFRVVLDPAKPTR